MKLTKEQIISRLLQHKPQLLQKYPLKSIALFGSFARGDETPESDIDLLVDFTRPVGMEIVDLTLELEEILAHKVDLVTFNAIKNRLFHQIKDELEYV
jgi:uncharacterized protein